MTIKVGIVGFGGAGQAQANYMRLCKNLSFAGFWDPYEVKYYDRGFRTRRRIRNYKRYKSYEEMLADTGIDAISICSPDYIHYEQALKALEHHKHLIVEKPLVSKYEDGLKIKDLAQKNKLIVAVQHQMRFVSLYQKIKALIAAGKLGTISAIEADYVQFMKKRFVMYHDWRLHRETASSAIIGAGVHFVDLICWLNEGALVKEVYAVGSHRRWPEFPSEESVSILMKFDNGVTGKIYIDFASLGPQRHPITIYGSQGMIMNNLHYHSADPDQYPISSPYTIIDEPKVKGFQKAWMKAQKLYSQLTGKYPLYNYPFYFYNHVESCIKSLNNFADAVVNGRQPLVGIDQGLRSIKICNSIEASLTKGGVVTVND